MENQPKDTHSLNGFRTDTIIRILLTAYPELSSVNNHKKDFTKSLSMETFLFSHKFPDADKPMISAVYASRLKREINWNIHRNEYSWTSIMLSITESYLIITFIYGKL